jgi:hypothetical protein
VIGFLDHSGFDVVDGFLIGTVHNNPPPSAIDTMKQLNFINEQAKLEQEKLDLEESEK